MSTIPGFSSSSPPHCVGVGFPARSLFRGAGHDDASPFLLLDDAGPAEPAIKPRGAGVHPALILSGAPINEPAAMQGSLGMNTAGDIKQARLDVQRGHFGAIKQI